MVRITNDVKTFIQRIKKKHPRARVFLFGSRATGHARRDSDWDFFIVADSFAGRRYLDRASEMYHLSTHTFPMDVLCYTPEEFDQEKKAISLVNEAIRTKSMVEVRA